MKRYDSYKDSGVEWIGEIPSHWINSKYKFHTNILSGFPFKSDLFDNEDGFPILRIRDITSGSSETFYKGDYQEEYVVKKGDLLIGMDGDFNIRWWNNYDVLLNQRCCSIKEFESVKRRFLFYVLPFDLQVINDLTYYTTVKHLSNSDIYNSSLVIPPLSEQQQIVSFLDTKTSLIDSLIEKTQRKIELLKEKRTSLINEVVTKGLNPNVEMKDSGVEWIGEIPSHWIKTKVKYISDVVRGSILRPVDEPLYFDENGEWTYLNISDVSKVEKFLNYGKLRLSELGSTKSRRVEPNNLIITGSGTVGKVFINTIPVCVHDGFIPILNLKVNINFMFYYLINPNLYVGIGKTNSQKNIYLDEVKEMDISIPSDTEQQKIVEYLDEQTQLIDKTISIEEKRIKLLKEYRQSLISEVVTGKRKVV